MGPFGEIVLGLVAGHGMDMGPQCPFRCCLDMGCTWDRSAHFVAGWTWNVHGTEVPILLIQLGVVPVK